MNLALVVVAQASLLSASPALLVRQPQVDRRVVVLPLRGSDDVAPGVAGYATSLLLQDLREFRGMRAVPYEDVASSIDLDLHDVLQACANADCASRAAEALDVDDVIYGELAVRGPSYVLTCFRWSRRDGRVKEEFLRHIPVSARPALRQAFTEAGQELFPEMHKITASERAESRKGWATSNNLSRAAVALAGAGGAWFFATVGAHAALVALAAGTMAALDNQPWRAGHPLVEMFGVIPAPREQWDRFRVWERTVIASPIVAIIALLVGTTATVGAGAFGQLVVTAYFMPRD